MLLLNRLIVATPIQRHFPQIRYFTRTTKAIADLAVSGIQFVHTCAFSFYYRAETMQALDECLPFGHLAVLSITVKD